MIEYRAKNNPYGLWSVVNANTKFDELNMDYYSVRVNKNNQYHRVDTPGFKEAYNKAIAWMKLTGKYDDVWSHW